MPMTRAQRNAVRRLRNAVESGNAALQALADTPVASIPEMIRFGVRLNQLAEIQRQHDQARAAALELLDAVGIDTANELPAVTGGKLRALLGIG
jgi:ABC-type dipeptide/oligopeptide/nickel transport system ATPase component